MVQQNRSENKLICPECNKNLSFFFIMFAAQTKNFRCGHCRKKLKAEGASVLFFLNFIFFAIFIVGYLFIPNILGHDKINFFVPLIAVLFMDILNAIIIFKFSKIKSNSS